MPRNWVQGSSHSWYILLLSWVHDCGHHVHGVGCLWPDQFLVHTNVVRSQHQILLSMISQYAWTGRLPQWISAYQAYSQEYPVEMAKGCNQEESRTHECVQWHLGDSIHPLLAGWISQLWFLLEWHYWVFSQLVSHQGLLQFIIN